MTSNSTIYSSPKKKWKHMWQLILCVNMTSLHFLDIWSKTSLDIAQINI